MPVKNMKGALGASLKAEETAVKNRFERAETALARNDVGAPPSRPLAASEPERVKRDSFTMPVVDYERIARLQKRCMRAEIGASKSEILRAGLAALDALTDEQLAAVVRGLDKVKTGRRPQNTV
jgi:hypothetical protein